MYYLPYLLFQRLHDAAINARRKNRPWKYFAFSVAAAFFSGQLIAVGLLPPATWADALLEISKRRRQSVGQILRTMIDRGIMDDRTSDN